MSPESSKPSASGDVIVPPPTVFGAASPVATRGAGALALGEKTQIAVLAAFSGFEKATIPELFRNAAVPMRGIGGFAGLIGLHGPAVANGTRERVPSLLPTKRPPQRLKS